MKVIGAKQLCKVLHLGDEEALLIKGKKQLWNALDVLTLNDLHAGDRLRAVIQLQLLPDTVAHEFECRCLEMAWTGNAQVKACVTAKRAWLRGEITAAELVKAWSAPVVTAYNDTPHTTKSLWLSIGGAAMAVAADDPVNDIGAADNVDDWVEVSGRAIIAAHELQVNVLLQMLKRA